MASIYQQILEAFKANIDDLELEFGDETIPTAIRKLPTSEETLDTVPEIVICPDETAERIKAASFENLVEVEYRIEVVLVAPGNRDFEANLGQWLTYREEIRRLFNKVPLEGTGPDLGKVFHLVPDLRYVLDRDKLSQNYDYNGMAFVATAIETR